MKRCEHNVVMCACKKQVLDGVLPLNAPRKTPKVVKQMNELKEPKQMIDEEHEEITMSKAGWVHLSYISNIADNIG